MAEYDIDLPELLSSLYHPVVDEDSIEIQDDGWVHYDFYEDGKRRTAAQMLPHVDAIQEVNDSLNALRQKLTAYQGKEINLVLKILAKDRIKAKREEAAKKAAAAKIPVCSVP